MAGGDGIPLVAISNSVSTTMKLATMFDVSNWSAPAGSAEREQAGRRGMACCVESLLASDKGEGLMELIDQHRDPRQGFVHVVLDEASSVLAYLALAGTERVQKDRSVIVGALRDLIRLPQVRVFISDAHLSNVEVDLVAKWQGHPRTRLIINSTQTRPEDRPVNVSFIDQQHHTKRRQHYLCALKRLVDHALNNEPIWLMAGTVETLLWTSRDLLPCHHPDRRLLITSETRKTDSRVKRFLADPETEAAKYDQIFSSPCITTNVSVVGRSYHACVLQEQHWTATDVVQALNRNRTALSRSLIALTEREPTLKMPNYSQGEKSFLNGFMPFTSAILDRHVDESRNNQDVITALLIEEGFTMQSMAEIWEVEEAKQNQRRIRQYLASLAPTFEQAANELGLNQLANHDGGEIRGSNPALKRFWDGLLRADSATLKAAGLDPIQDRPAKGKRQDMRFMKPRLRKTGFDITTKRCSNGATVYAIRRLPA